MASVGEIFRMFFPKYSQGSPSTALESDQAENNSLEEPVRQDSEMPTPGSVENHAAEPETEESFEFLFDGSESGDESALFGDSTSGEDTAASSEDKSEEPVRQDSAMPTPVSGQDGDEDELEAALRRAMEEEGVDDDSSTSAGEGDAGEDTGAPSRFPGLALPRRLPAAPPAASPAAASPPAASPPSASPPAASSTPTPSTQPDANPAASVNAQSRKRTRDDDPTEIEDSSPEPAAKRARKEKKKSRRGPAPCTSQELDARNGAARIQLGLGSHRYSFFGSNATQDRYGKLAPSKTKGAIARREALDQLINSIPSAETELPLPEGPVDTAVSESSNGTTVDAQGEPSTSAPRASPPASLSAGASSSGPSPTSSRTTIDLTGETGPAQGTSSPASLGSGRSNNGAATTSSRTTIDLTRAGSPLQQENEQLAEPTHPEEPASTPESDLPAPTNGSSSVHDDLLKSQMEALNAHNAALSAELRGHQARGHMTDISIDFSGSQGVFKGKRQMKRNNDMRNHRARQRRE
ncbi:hypothetical protein AC578_7379 [Pseudocercospora eumusae]|uniref:Uncharacterized protein n=1 Tax=Pseudocercospora eumusae TaxID=321146 RepID=A0A139H4N8_9PEZI|nr:hypothetical protein AC578_7379 [Pseudocercospora eumusae]